MPNPTRRYFTPPEIAERLLVSVKKILHWIDTGELLATNTATRRDGRPRWKISPEALQAFELARASRATQAAPRQQTRRRSGSTDVIQFV